MRQHRRVKNACNGRVPDSRKQYTPTTHYKILLSILSTIILICLTTMCTINNVSSTYISNSVIESQSTTVKNAFYSVLPYANEWNESAQLTRITCLGHVDNGYFTVMKFSFILLLNVSTLGNSYGPGIQIVWNSSEISTKEIRIGFGPEIDINNWTIDSDYLYDIVQSNEEIQNCISESPWPDDYLENLGLSSHGWFFGQSWSDCKGETSSYEVSVSYRTGEIKSINNEINTCNITTCSSSAVLILIPLSIVTCNIYLIARKKIRI